MIELREKINATNIKLVLMGAPIDLSGPRK
jgi:hypothetical protein